MSYKLAIVIPAFKHQFLKSALESIAKQDCKDFTVYIGDDASIVDLFEIVEPFVSKFNLVYTRFTENVGSKSLTEQWERCISLISDESYIWLFSDDDEMSENAVSSFYKELELTNESFDVYRFDLQIIDEKNGLLEKIEYPIVQHSNDFFISRIHESTYSCITQYIFKRTTYIRNNGFVPFPLAWFSDDASILLYSKNNGIKRIADGIVFWRLANNINITASDIHSKLKSRAVFEYANWFKDIMAPYFEREEFKRLAEAYFKKRLSKMSLFEYLNINSIRTVNSHVGFLRTVHLYVRNTFNRSRSFLGV